MRQRRWGVGARLGLALLLVLAGAFAIIYYALVPSLEQRLVDNRIEQLQRTAFNLQVPEPFEWNEKGALRPPAAPAIAASSTRRWRRRTFR